MRAILLFGIGPRPEKRRKPLTTIVCACVLKYPHHHSVANFAAWLLMHIVHAIERAEPFPVAEPQVAPLLSLPLELHCVILAHLDLSSLLSVSYTCKTLRNALLHPYAWARICHASDGGSDILEQLEPRSRCRRRRTRHQAAAVCRVYY